MSGIFKILFDLQIKSHNQPLEDYLTEIFAFCLNQDGEMFNAFLAFFNLVDRGIDEYIISTQYELAALSNQSIDSRPDMVLNSRNITIFFENKINAVEGDKQLQRYAEQLDQVQSADKILVYITRDYDPKDKKEITERCKNEIKFFQLRWHRIFQFLEGYKENPIILELLKFMKQNKLAMNNQFSPIEIITMVNFSRVSKIMDETMFGEIAELFEQIHGKITQPSTRLTQFEKHDRYVYYAAYKNEIFIFLGYWMNSDNEKDYPEVGIEIDINPNSNLKPELGNTKRDILDKFENWESDNMNDPRKWPLVYRKKSLQEFLSEEDHIISIKSFFKDALGDLEKIYSEFPVLRES